MARDPQVSGQREDVLGDLRQLLDELDRLALAHDERKHLVLGRVQLRQQLVQAQADGGVEHKARDETHAQARVLRRLVSHMAANARRQCVGCVG